MRLSVSHNGGSVDELRFQKGPVYLGRQIGSQIFLPDRAISRQHAVLYTTKAGTWILEDLDSVNKTFLNQNAIHKNEIKDGDIIDIAGFSIIVHFNDEADQLQQPVPIHMDETIADVKPGIQVVVRKHAAPDAPLIKMPAKRTKDFSRAVRMICRAANLKELHRGLLSLILGQFSALDVWVGLRTSADGPMEYQGGRKITAEAANLNELVCRQNIIEAMEKRKYELVPQIPRQLTNGKVRSAIVAPILRDGKCYGAIYADNAADHERYGTADIDYLMLLSILVAEIMSELAS